jgi:hypothetical protein
MAPEIFYLVGSPKVGPIKLPKAILHGDDTSFCVQRLLLKFG